MVRFQARPQGAKMQRREAGFTPLCAGSLSAHPRPLALASTHTWTRAPRGGGCKFQQKGGCSTSREEAVAHSHLQTERSEEKSTDLEMGFPAQLGTEVMSPHNSA